MALNKANQRVGTEFRRRLAAATGIRQKTLRQTIRQYKAGRGRMLAKTWMGLDRRIPMSEVLKGKGTAIPDIYAQLLERGPTGSKPCKLGNRRGLYVRHGRKRLPVRELKMTVQEVAPPILREVGDSIAAAEFQRTSSSANCAEPFPALPVPAGPADGQATPGGDKVGRTISGNAAHTTDSQNVDCHMVSRGVNR